MVSKLNYDFISKSLDFALVSPALKDLELEKGCEQAIEYKVASVSILPYYLPRCVQILSGSGVYAGTTIGFPHGCQASAVKLAEVAQALRDGAEEVDAVVNISKIRSGDWYYVERELLRLTDAVHVAGAKIKIIFENAYLDDCDKIRLCEVCADVGADWVKSSTGFGPGGATLDDIRLMRHYSPAQLRVKAAGGIRDLEAVIQMRDAGADRVGTSQIQPILDALRNRLEMGAVKAPVAEMEDTLR